MATTEERVDKLETKFSTLAEQFAATMAKVDSLAEEAKQQREDIRRLNEKHTADMKTIDTKFDSLTKQINDTWRQTMIGVGGMIIALGALLISALK